MKLAYVIDIDPITENSFLIKGIEKDGVFYCGRVLKYSGNDKYNQFNVKNGFLVNKYTDERLKSTIIEDFNHIFYDKAVAVLFYELNFNFNNFVNK